MTDNKNKILLVDDEHANLQLLQQILQDKYQLSYANSGIQAVKIANKLKPDLILLDIMMPDMDGYETCRNLKSNPATASIPVMFLSALGEEEDETFGFEVGGVDFLSKPIKPLILQARVHTQLELKKNRDDLLRQNEILQENVKLREDIDNITRHDLKAPLIGMINIPKLIMKNSGLEEKQQILLKSITKSAYRMLNMINLSLDLYKMEIGVFEYCSMPVNLAPIVWDIVEENRSLIRLKNLTINTDFGDNPDKNDNAPAVSGDELLFYSMLSNTIKNAIEASPDDEMISIRIEMGNDTKIRIRNRGEVPLEIRDRFFDKYVTKGKDGGTGLGTYSAALIAKTMGGSACLNTADSLGTEVIFTLPNRPYS